MAKGGPIVMASIAKELKYSFTTGNVAIKLIYANVGIFFLVCLSEMLSNFGAFPRLVDYLWMPTTAERIMFKPWTVFTYMFTHKDFIHVFFNMLNLYWFGQIMIDYMGEKAVMKAYITGGLAGAITCLIWSSISPIGGNMLGASAAILAIMAATATAYPNRRINVVFVGEVKLKYFALVLTLVYLVCIFGGSSNIGGNVAHIGGIIAGFTLAKYWKRGYIFSEKRNMHVVYNSHATDYEYNELKSERTREVDRILDKIKQSGYDSLTSDEKKMLFEESKK